MHVTLWDLILLVVLIFYGVHGWRQGLVASLLGIFGSFFALLAALAGADRLAAPFADHLGRPLLEEKLSVSGTAATAVYEGVGFFIAFILIFVLISLALHFVIRLTHLIQIFPVIGTANALLGSVVGVLLGAAVCTVFLYFLKLYAPSLFGDAGLFRPAIQNQSFLLPYFISGNPGGFLRFIYQQILTHFSSI